jgi:hypothetical protein
MQSLQLIQNVLKDAPEVDDACREGEDGGGTDDDDGGHEHNDQQIDWPAVRKNGYQRLARDER